MFDHSKVLVKAYHFAKCCEIRVKSPFAIVVRFKYSRVQDREGLRKHYTAKRTERCKPWYLVRVIVGDNNQLPTCKSSVFNPVSKGSIS